MALSKTYPVQIVSLSGKESSGQLLVQEWSPQDQMRNGLKFLGIFWGLAIVSVIIPIAHFILVPGFLISGPFVAFWAYKRTSIITGGTGSCPECGASLAFTKGTLKWPMSDLCDRCQAGVKLHHSSS